MSIEHIEVNGHELTAFDLPPEPSETYEVHVDGLGEIVIEKGKPPKEKDVPAMYMRKLVPELCEQNAELNRENAKLREQMERLVTLLRNDCDIDASWDGLRKFWSIELTENGCLMRDRACKAEAENAKLRELAVLNWEWAHSCCGNNCKMQTDGCGYQIDRECNYEREIAYLMRDLGIEADE